MWGALEAKKILIVAKKCITEFAMLTFLLVQIISINLIHSIIGLPCSSNGKEFASNTGDQGSNSRSERSSEEGNGNPLQYSCLENSMDRETSQATVHGVTERQTRLSD